MLGNARLVERNRITQEQSMAKLPQCADCGGFDVEWMYRCPKHGLEYCRGCSCPECDEEAGDSYEDDGTMYDTEHSELR